MQLSAVFYQGICFLCDIILFSLLMKQRIERRKQKLTIENLNLYNESLINLYDSVRSFKHDFINFIQALNGYIQCNDMDGVRSLANSIYNESKIMCNMEEINPELINNPAIYNLIANKYKISCQKNIMMNIEVNYNLLELNIDTYKICRILGILIDNAIEAAENCEEKVVNIRFIKQANIKSILIENTYHDDEIEIDNIFKKGYTTKKDNLKHGLGLWKVKDMIDNTNNLSIITSKNKLFSQELLIHDKEIDFFHQNDKILVKSK